MKQDKQEKQPEWLEIKDSQIPGAGLGAYSKVAHKRGARLGEYEGRRLDPEQFARVRDFRYVFELRRNGRPVAYIDGRQRKSSNWTRYVNCARTKEEENILATQEGMRIVYRAKRPIRPGEELLVWYGPVYGEWLLGLSEPT